MDDYFFGVIGWMGLVSSAFLSAARYFLYLKYDEVIDRIAPIKVEYMKSLDPTFPTKESSLADSKKCFCYMLFFALMLVVRYIYL